MSFESLLLCYWQFIDILRGVAHWVWGQAVQEKLDEIMKENRFHKVRKQKKIFLPSGGRPIDFWQNPQKWKGQDQLIQIPPHDIDRLIAEYADPTCLLFGEDAIISIYRAVWEAIGKPRISALNAWSIWRLVVDYLAVIEAQLENTI